MMYVSHPNRCDDELPCDLLAFLEQRLGLDERAALDSLGNLLSGYEPSEDARRKLSA